MQGTPMSPTWSDVLDFAAPNGLWTGAAVLLEIGYWSTFREASHFVFNVSLF
jgi:hypothetical protein